MRNMLNKLMHHIKNNYKEMIINILIISFFLFASIYNFPYLIYKPGGTIPLESRMYINDKKVLLGDYNLAYVSVSRGNLLNLIFANVIKDWDVVKEDKMLIPETDYDTTFKIEKIDMQNSINIAKYIAYQKAGKDVELKIKSNYIYAIDKTSDTDLQVLDEIISIDNMDFDLDKMTSYINELALGTKITFQVMNDNTHYERYGIVSKFDDRKAIGVYISSIYETVTVPKIEIKAKDSEAGSSGGMMMTLAIYDALTDKDMTSGKKIVGTGTIEIDGSIGGIGGVKYKLLGAKKAKADIFFIPSENYEEAKTVYDEYKLKFDLVSISNFDEVIAYLDSI
ncbi:MAG: hypothetical protein IKR74_02030 [Bacilli bacterium]|nr:hypothetical protein [Bacilli bacterium]